MILNDTDSLQGYSQWFIDFTLARVEIREVIEAYTYKHWISPLDLNISVGLLENSLSFLLSVLSKIESMVQQQELRI